MRSICYGILLWCIALCALASCSDEENVVPSFNVTTNDGEALNHASITFKSEGGSAAINITSNSQWQIECEAEWVDISPREGQGNGSVVITADATTAARSAVAVAYLSDYKQMNQSFNIIQYAPSNADDQPDNGEDNPTDDPNEDGGEGNPTDNPNNDGNEDKPTDNPNEDGGEDNGDDSPTNDPNEDGGEDKPTDNPNDDGNEDKPTDNPNDDGGENNPTDNPNEDGGEDKPTDNPNEDGGEDNPNDNPNEDGGEDNTTDNPNEDGGEDKPTNNPNEDGGEDKPTDNPNDDGNEDNPTDNPNGDGENKDDNGSVDNPGNNPDDSNSNTPGDDSDDSSGDDSGDGSDDGSGNTPGNTPDGDTPNTDSDNPSDSNQDDDDEQGNEDSVATYTPITTTDALAAGTYYLGGYQGSTLHLASFGEGDRSGHYYTAPYTYDNVSGTLTPQQSAQAIKVTLKAVSGSNCYYIHFDGEGYLSATSNTAGKLIFTPEPVRAWRFTTGDGGFVVIQDDSLYVKLIISKRAADRLLRSIDGYEEGNPIVLFRQN